jgi:hypothetical protein
VSDDDDTGKRPPGTRMDEERTPPYPSPAPEHLPPREVRRIERVLGRQADPVHMALAERYRAEGADPLVMLAQIAIDVHDLKKPVSIATRVVYWAAGGIIGAIGFVAWIVSSQTAKDTAVEYRLRACEATKSELERFERAIRPDYPVAAAPPSRGPEP